LDFSVPARALSSFPTRRSSDLCCLHVRTASQLFVQIYGCVQPGKSAAQNDDFGFFHWLFLSAVWPISCPVAKLTGFEPFLRSLRDRKSTRLNSSHGSISYAVFC